MPTADIADLADRYFEAWNTHDAEAIVATFGAGGSYRDPTMPEPLRGPAIGAYAAALWEAFDDLSFEIGSRTQTAGGRVAAEWTMRGTNTGAFAGLPPTGKTVRLPGVDVIEAGPDGIASVTGYFDSVGLPRQLGLQVLVQPTRLGPFAFGNSVTVESGKKTRPGAFSITSIWNADDQDATIRELSVETAKEMLGMEGFIGLTLARVGGRGITISAWESPEHTKQLYRSAAHREAMARFWKDVGDAAFTSVWSPAYINPLWVRCTDCGKMNDHAQSAGRCACGSALPEAPGYF